MARSPRGKGRPGSAFDGAHAFLLRANVDPRGALQGDFWAMGGYHAAWRAERMEPGDAPVVHHDPTVFVSPQAENGRFAFEPADQPSEAGVLRESSLNATSRP